LLEKQCHSGLIFRYLSEYLGASMSACEIAATPTKNILQTLKDVALIVASVAVPLAIAWVGGEYNARIKEAENRIRYIELAISQLRSAPTPETAALREWAVELLDSQAPIKLSEAAKTQLKSYALPIALSASASGSAFASGTLGINK
jgi:hypothetical protein